MTTPTAATPTPEELAEACLKDFARNIGHGSLRERLAAAIRQHSEALMAENERLTKERDTWRADWRGEKAEAERLDEHAGALECSLEQMRAALSASLERERGMREALTVAYDLSTWAGCTVYVYHTKTAIVGLYREASHAG